MRFFTKWLIIFFALLAAGPAVAQIKTPERSQVDVETAIADTKATMQIDPRAALAKAARAERVAYTVADPMRRRIAVITAEWLQGEAYVRLNQTDRAEPLVRHALAAVLSSDPNSKLHGDILMSRGGIHSNRAQVGLALRDYQQAYDAFGRIGETRSQAIALSNIAVLYQEAKDYNNALKYFRQASEIFHEDPSLLVSIYNNRADALKELGRYDESDAQFREALSIARSMNSPIMEAQILRNIARSELLAGHLGVAERTLREGAVVSRNAGGSDEAAYVGVVAQAALQRHRFAEAATLIGRSFAGVDLATTTLSYREAHQTAYETYRALGRPDLALLHLAALKRLDDEATKLATTTNTALMAARFDFANQELKITKLTAEDLKRKIAFERAQAKSQMQVFVGAAAATALIIAMLAFALITIRRSRNEVRAANDDLAITNSALGKALAAKTEFLATTSHEIRTPLNGILGMTQVMLADAKLEPRTRDRIGVVHAAGITMRALVDDILDVAKMETGHMTIEAAPFDLRAALSDAMRLWEEQARSKGVAFALDLDDCPATVEGDAARVRQVTFNLLSNALKFTADGAIAVRATVATDDSTYSIAVCDTGIGIPAEKLEDIFESFRQADAGTTRQFGGTGLGLAICRNLARAMGGEVTVASEPGAGSTFTVTLPLMRVAPAAPVEAMTVSDGPALLIVDRNPITRAMFRALLEPHAGTVVFVGSAEDAVERLASLSVSRILIDDATVRVGGNIIETLTAVAQAARAADAETTLLWPVAADIERSEFLATGIDSVISKPVSGGALVAALFATKPAIDAKLPLVSQAA